MVLDIDGAGRSRSLACLPTARGTAAPTRGQVPGGVLLGPVLVPYKVVEALGGWFFPGWILRGLGGAGPYSASAFRNQGS